MSAPVGTSVEAPGVRGKEVVGGRKVREVGVLTAKAGGAFNDIPGHRMATPVSTAK